MLIAERSEHGWVTVTEYEDEKRLFRAELRAGRKSKQKSLRESKKKGGPPAKKPFRNAWSGPEHVQSSDALFAPGMHILVPLVHGPRLTSVPATAGTSQIGPCFMCGKMGHYRSCPLLQAILPLNLKVHSNRYCSPPET